MIPLRSKNPPESFPIGTIALIVANVGIYLATQEGGQVRADIVEAWALKGSNPDFVHLLSSMFLHANPLHIVGNMWFLYLFGFAVEGRLRTIKFLLLYLLSGIAGSALQLIVFADHPNTPSLGASGAIMGVMGAAMYLFPHAQVTILWRFSTYDWPMCGVGLYFLGFDIVEGALFGGADGVGHFAHIGGALAGAIIAFALRARRDDQTTSEAKAMLHETKDLSVLSPHELQALAAADPSNTTITLNWAHRCLRDPRGMPAECRDTFLRQLPKMLKDHEHNISPVAAVVSSLAATPGTFKPHQLMDLATRVERIPDPQLAWMLYNNVLADPASMPQDREASLFRIGLLCENHFLRPQDAAAWYDRLLQEFPMGPFADQARMRLNKLRVRV